MRNRFQEALNRVPLRNPFSDETPAPPPSTPEASTFFECLYGPHKAEVLHKGTGYCRKCYDDKNRLGLLVDR